MIEDLWTFLQNPENRETLGWIGGGLVVLAGGLWTVIQSRARKPKTSGGGTGGTTVNSGNTVNYRAGLSGGQLAAILLCITGLALFAIAQGGNTVTATGGSSSVGGDVEGSTITVGD
ncbi:hypothetical protein R5H30_20255 [Sulfitobacter sp. D35]|uniref:hypothetical protein n=1 Tax=Sulfitobacter sp. D35 TaxID=3083252 RepID=UPI00296FDE0C|nr:hypothetical protein [Sulfitobacter sp. D35]MDW4500332.1 hypothetical protein [Sulfitobacter sp. D35]